MVNHIRIHEMADIDYAVIEAYQMQLSTEQSIKFVMNMAKVNREQAKAAIKVYERKVIMAH